MNLNKLQAELKDLHGTIKTLLRYSKYSECNDLSGLEDDFENLSADERLVLDELRGVMEHLEDVSYLLSYLERPIKHEDVLHFNPRSERYECDYHEYTCGNRIEFLWYDEFDECERWSVSRVEHSREAGGYYIVGYRSVSLDGLRVRFR